MATPKKQLENLKEKAANRRVDVQDVSAKLESVNDNLRRTRTSLDRASAELDMHEPIGRDLEAIKRQQDELKVKPDLIEVEPNHHRFGSLPCWFNENMCIYWVELFDEYPKCFNGVLGEICNILGTY